MQSYMAQLKSRWQTHNTLVCVGLDPLPALLPQSVQNHKQSLLVFNQAIIDATHDLVCAYKPQIAHYAALGAEAELQATIAYIHQNYPGIPVILDSKRGDIDSTAERYAVEAFERYEADAVTINPYMGMDTVAPFTQYRDKGVIVLCRTSNPSAAELQNLTLNTGEPLYMTVARLACSRWNEHGNLNLVVGATAPEELAAVRRVVGEMPILVPGLGSQGGSADAVLRAGLTTSGTGLIINSSRAILYASPDEDFASAARAETLALQQTIQSFRNQTH